MSNSGTKALQDILVCLFFPFPLFAIAFKLSESRKQRGEENDFQSPPVKFFSSKTIIALIVTREELRPASTATLDISRGEHEKFN
jgi:hypothetical protein